MPVLSPSPSSRRLAALVALALAGPGCGDAGSSLRPLGSTCEDDAQCDSGLCYEAACVDPAVDDDLDGLTTGLEVALGSDPHAADTDGDGVRDGDEVDPLTLAARDSDGDGEPDLLESRVADADGDCTPDELDADDRQNETASKVCRTDGVCAGHLGDIVLTCVPGGAPRCDYAAVPGYAEHDGCDGVDSDCDGATDEDERCELPTGVGSCADVAVAEPEAASGEWRLDPDGAGPAAEVVTACDMTTAGGGWTRLDPTWQARLAAAPAVPREYLLRAPTGAWLRTPATSAVWSWSAGAPLPGVWLGAWSSGALDAFDCAAGSASAAGFSCVGVAPQSADAARATVTVCQSGLGVLGSGCVTDVLVWFRDARCPASPPSNLVADPGFDDPDLACWSGDGSPDAEHAASGAAPALALVGEVAQRAVALSAHHAYRLTFAARGPDGGTLAVGLAGASRALPLVGTWQRLEVDLVPTATTLDGGPTFTPAGGSATSAADPVAIDDVTLADLGPFACLTDASDATAAIADPGFLAGTACWSITPLDADHRFRITADDDAPTSGPSLRVEVVAGTGPTLGQRLALTPVADHRYALAITARGTAVLRASLAGHSLDAALGDAWATIELPLGTGAGMGGALDLALTVLPGAAAGAALASLDDVRVRDLGPDPCAEGCGEDRLSIAAGASGRPFVAARPHGGALTAWFGAQVGEAWARVSDADESRRGREVATWPAVAIFPTAPVARPGGGYATLRTDAYPSAPNNLVYHTPFALRVRRWDEDLALVDELQVGTLAASNAGQALYWTMVIDHPRLDLVALSGDGLAALSAYANPSVPAGTGIRYRALEAGGVLSPEVTVVAPAAIAQSDLWDAAVADGDDRVVLAWVAPGGTDLVAQRIGRDGAAELAVPSPVATASGAVARVAVAALSDGGAVVAWQSGNPSQVIAARRLASDLAPVGDPVTLASSTALALGDLALAPGAGPTRLAVSWRDGAPATPRARARTFDRDGALGPVVELPLTSAIGAAPPALAGVLDAGLDGTGGEGWLAAWTDPSGVVWTRRFDADLAPTAAALDRDPTTEDFAALATRTPSVAVSASGRALMAWTRDTGQASLSDIAVRAFDRDGVALGPEGSADASDFPATTPVVASALDRFAVVWTSDGEDGDGEGVVARRFDDDGLPEGPEFVVPGNTTNYQRQPAAAMAPDGTLVVLWNGASSTPADSSSDVFARVLAPTAASAADAAPELRLNTITSRPQDRPAVAVVPGERAYVAAWISHAATTGSDVYVSRLAFDATTAPTEVLANVTTAGEQRNPSVAVTQSGAVVVCWEAAGQGGAGHQAIACRRFAAATLAAQTGEVIPFASDLDQSAPVVRPLTTGGLALAWGGAGLDWDGTAVALGRITLGLAAAAPALVAARDGAGDEAHPALAPLDDRLFVAWDQTIATATTIAFRVLAPP